VSQRKTNDVGEKQVSYFPFTYLLRHPHREGSRHNTLNQPTLGHPLLWTIRHVERKRNISPWANQTSQE